MAQDTMNQFYTCLNLPLYEKLRELTRIIDHSSPTKELQALFPQLITNIFSGSFSSGWGLRSTTFDQSRGEFELLVSFLEPHGPMFRLCYKLLSDPLLKYNLPLNLLPQNLQLTLERGRCPQFYADMIHMDSQAMNVVALALNPFDYYIFSFALNLVTNSPNQSWENWNSVYFALACDYLMHFLPADPNVTVLPLIPHYMGKVPVVAPLQTANRQLCSPSLLLVPELSCISQQSPAQTQTRNEVWRSETVLQVLIDVWMSVEDSTRSMELSQRNYAALSSSPERVRTVRVLIKHIHSYSAKHLADPAARSSALRKYARQIMCARAYTYVRELVTTWPLDASFRLVMELWLSLIQPWRYTDGSINKDRFPNAPSRPEERGGVDASYTQFIAENFPTYTSLLQLVLPRFERLDLTAYKNAIMLFRLGKVFSQPPLVATLRELERAITERGSGVYYSPDTSWNTSNFDHSNNNSYSAGVNTNKWVAVARQAVAELNLSTNFQYEPVWGPSQKQNAQEFIYKIYAATKASERAAEECQRKIQQNSQGIWASIKHWLMISGSEDEAALEEVRRVTSYLGASVLYMSIIFELDENTLLQATEVNVNETLLEQSSFANSTNFANFITKKLRDSPTDVKYMGDPDLAPITSYESTILVRILYQMSSRLNEMYQDEFSSLWSRIDFLGYIAREILQRPCTIQTYVKDATHHQHLVRQALPARLSLRRLGSHACIFWLVIGYIVFRLFSYSGFFYAFILCMMFVAYVLTKSTLKSLRVMS